MLLDPDSTHSVLYSSQSIVCGAGVPFSISVISAPKSPPSFCSACNSLIASVNALRSWFQQQCSLRISIPCLGIWCPFNLAFCCFLHRSLLLQLFQWVALNTSASFQNVAFPFLLYLHYCCISVLLLDWCFWFCCMLFEQRANLSVLYSIALFLLAWTRVKMINIHDRFCCKIIYVCLFIVLRWMNFLYSSIMWTGKWVTLRRSGMKQTNKLKVLLLHKYWWRNSTKTVSGNIYAFSVFRPACSLLRYPFNFSFCFVTIGVIMSLAVIGLFCPVLRLIVMSMTNSYLLACVWGGKKQSKKKKKKRGGKKGAIQRRSKHIKG